MARYAIKTPPQNAEWDDILAIWKEADGIDVFGSAWVFDHFYALAGDDAGPCLEAWVTLTALTTATSRLRIGCMVHGMHFRHPAVTANMAATLDIVSDGRLNLGLGAGWYEPEAEAYGIPLGSLAERLDRFAEGLEVVARLLSQETTSFSGQYYELQNAYCAPKGPRQPHPPITVGGSGPKRTIPLVARWAQGWDALRLDLEEWKQRNALLEEHCERLGRDSSEITRSVHVMWADEDPKKTAEAAAEAFDAGVDLAVFSMRAPYDVRRVAPLAEALREL